MKVARGWREAYEAEFRAKRARKFVLVLRMKKIANAVKGKLNRLKCEVESLRGQPDALERATAFFGKLPDKNIAQVIGITENVLRKLRHALGLPGFDMEKLEEEAAEEVGGLFPTIKLNGQKTNAV